MDFEVVLETPRLLLRRWQEDDLKALQSILCDHETMAHWPQPFDEASSAAWLSRAVGGVDAPLTGRLAVHRKDDQQLIGDAGLLRIELNGQMENDLGYIIHRNHWRQGFGSEVARGLLDYAHGPLGCERVIANMAEDNLPSSAVARKLGMELETKFRNPKNLNKTHFLYVSAR